LSGIVRLRPGEGVGDDFFQGWVFDDDIFDGVLGEQGGEGAGDVDSLDA
jgi:hypothetical protein